MITQLPLPLLVTAMPHVRCEMCVGLIKQYHYVGLNKMCDSSIEQTAQNVQTISAENVTVANTDS